MNSILAFHGGGGGILVAGLLIIAAFALFCNRGK
jgi:hypothetical protein